jgi:outer membrane protein OmpA-like peptidoglycan-associated protein
MENKLFLFYFAIWAFANINATAAQSTTKNLIFNGNFNNGNMGFFSDLKSVNCAVHRNSCGEFICHGTYAIANVPAVCNPDWVLKTHDHTSGFGNMMVLDLPSEANKMLWGQDCVLKPKTEYVFRFWSINLIENKTPAQIDIRINNEKIGSIIVENTKKWLFFEYHFTTDATLKKGEKTTFSIHNTTNEIQGCDMAIDDIVVEEAPMPKKPQEIEKIAPKNTPKIVEKTVEKTIKPVANLQKIPQKRIIITDTTTKITTNAIFWDAGKANIRTESFAALDDLAQALKKRPNCQITVVSHTDTRGKAEPSMALSLNRSKAVVDYLVEKGIAADRLTFKGMGLTEPLEVCPAGGCTEAQHQRNRRTEFLIAQ